MLFFFLKMPLYIFRPQTAVTGSSFEHSFFTAELVPDVKMLHGR